jgi:hypothetical protein
MSRFLLSAVSIFTLLITGLVLPRTADARRCDERMPLTLLSLYRTSDAIYVGRFEKVEDGEVTEETPDYSVVSIKKHFSISSALKGEPRKMLTISESDYRYKNVDAAGTDDEHGDSIDNSDLAKPGDPVMLFVAKDSETGAVDLTDTSDGIKKMTPEKMSAYEGRIKELKGILGSDKATHKELVQWMIGAAQDPLTRWEGTFELLQSIQNMEWQAEREKEAANKPEGESEDYVPETPKKFDTGDPDFARSITDIQKVTLTNILLNRERPKKIEEGEEPAELAYGDRELIEIVKRWGDSRVASNLLGQLRQIGSDATLKSELMSSIASMLHDGELTVISDEYAGIQWESDGDEIRAEVEAEPVAQEGPVVEPIAIEPEPAAEPAKPVESEGPAKEKKKKTYGELRAEIFGKFLSRADAVIAKEQNKKTAKLHH